MPSYIEIGCRCGHMVRATPQQGGTAVRCWHCGNPVSVPSPRAVNSVLARFIAAAGESLRPRALGALLAGSVGLTVLLMIPFLGNVLAFVALIVAGRVYQSLIRDNSPPTRSVGVEDEVQGGAPEWVAWVLSVLSAAALIAPFLVRNWVDLLPVPVRVRSLLVLAAFCGWLVVPLVLYAFNAHERHGDVPPGQALISLARMPMSALLTVLFLPLGFCALEAATAAITSADEFLPELIDTLYEPPRPILISEHPAMWYRFDDLMTTALLENETAEARWVYITGLRRGYTLVGTIPRTLSQGLETELGFPQHYIVEPVSLFKRMLLTIMILAVAGLVLPTQARWFGQIAWLSTLQDPKALTPPAASLEPLTASVPAPLPPPSSVPEPIPFSTPPPVPSLPVGTAAARTVLIVDGDRGYAVGLGRVLSDRGFGVLLASTAWEALALAKGARPDAVILDDALPDRSGIEICRELRDGLPGFRSPVVIATTSKVTAAMISAMAGAADDYLIKPYVFEALILRLNQRLQSRV